MIVMVDISRAQNPELLGSVSPVNNHMGLLTLLAVQQGLEMLGVCIYHNLSQQ